MTKPKQPPADKPGAPAPPRKPNWSPADDLYGDIGKPMDADLDLDKGKFSEPPPKT